MLRNGHPGTSLLFVVVTAPLVIVAGGLSGSVFLRLAPVPASGVVDRALIAALVLGLFVGFAGVAGAVGVLIVRGLERVLDVRSAVEGISWVNRATATATIVVFAVFVLGVAIQQLAVTLPRGTVPAGSLTAVMLAPFAPVFLVGPFVPVLGGPAILTALIAVCLTAVTGVWQVLLGIVVARVSARVGLYPAPAAAGEGE